MLFIGIDPGLDGAIGWIRSSGGDVGACVTPTILKTEGKGSRLYDLPLMRRVLIGCLLDYAPGVNTAERAQSSCVALEKQQAMKGQGVSSTFSIGRGYGLWEGLLVGLGVPYQLVHPKTWQKELLGGLAGGSKERSIQRAGALFPDLDLRASERSRIPHDGKADALCLAEWCRRQGV